MDEHAYGAVTWRSSAGKYAHFKPLTGSGRSHENSETTRFAVLLQYATSRWQEDQTRTGPGGIEGFLARDIAEHRPF